MNIKLKTDIKHLIVYRDIDIQNVNASINVKSGKVAKWMVFKAY